MFTGIIEQQGRVRASSPTPAGVRLVIDSQGWGYRARIGDSVAVNGCCLTIAADPAGAGGALVFDVIPETLRKTTIGALRLGARVHLEHAATPVTLLGGHLVQGHVDGVGEVLEVATGNERRAPEAASEWRVRIGLAAELMPYIVPKGSVAVDGVSLTVADLGRHGWFEVALIPTTLAKTTLGELAVGSRVNVECDAMAKTIVQYLQRMGGIGTPKCGA